MANVMQSKVELRDQAVDLTLRMLTPFVAESLSQKFIGCEEASAGLLRSFGVMTGAYDHARGGVEATIPRGAVEKIAEFPQDFELCEEKTDQDMRSAPAEHVANGRAVAAPGISVEP